MLEKQISVKEGEKESKLEKINITKEKGNEFSGVYLGYLEIGTSSIAKILLEAFENTFEYEIVGTETLVIDSQDFKKIIKELKETHFSTGTYSDIDYLIHNLEYLSNLDDEDFKGTEDYRIDFIHYEGVGIINRVSTNF